MFADNRFVSTECQIYVEIMLASYNIKMITETVLSRSGNITIETRHDRGRRQVLVFAPFVDIVTHKNQTADRMIVCMYVS